MTPRFNKCIPIILRNEGGFANDLHDPGGATNYGISIRTVRRMGLVEFDMNHNGFIDAGDIESLTPAIAKSFYFNYFWQNLQLELLQDDDLLVQVFDHSVNAGAHQAIRLLQQKAGVFDDGVMGVQTASAANSNTSLGEIYRTARKYWYLQLTLSRPSLARYLHGWHNRCDQTRFI